MAVVCAHAQHLGRGIISLVVMEAAGELRRRSSTPYPLAHRRARAPRTLLQAGGGWQGARRASNGCVRTTRASTRRARAYITNRVYTIVANLYFVNTCLALAGHSQGAQAKRLAMATRAEEARERAVGSRAVVLRG